MLQVRGVRYNKNTPNLSILSSTCQDLKNLWLRMHWINIEVIKDQRTTMTKEEWSKNVRDEIIETNNIKVQRVEKELKRKKKLIYLTNAGLVAQRGE